MDGDWPSLHWDTGFATGHPGIDTEHRRLVRLLGQVYEIELGTAAIDGLPEREKMVLSLYYDDELNLREIGEVLEVSESRVCQIHGQALVRLRARLTEWLQPG